MGLDIIIQYYTKQIVLVYIFTLDLYCIKVKTIKLYIKGIFLTLGFFEFTVWNMKVVFFGRDLKG